LQALQELTRSEKRARRSGARKLADAVRLRPAALELVLTTRKDDEDSSGRQNDIATHALSLSLFLSLRADSTLASCPAGSGRSRVEGEGGLF